MIPQILDTTPQKLAADTWLIPRLAAEPGGLNVGAHSLLIAGKEPVIVDTGVSLVREAWFDDVFGLVDPVDVKWIFLSHDDHDHLGNLLQALEVCPNATLVTNQSAVSRLAGDIPLPFDRMRWVNVGETWDAGDRKLQAVRPPMFDAPSTRGLFDASTGVMWAVDAFGALVQDVVYEADEVPLDLYESTFDLFNAGNTPWLEWVDAARFEKHLLTSSNLQAQVVASAHGPVLRGRRIRDAYERTAALIARPAPDLPGQEVLDAVVAGALGGEDPVPVP